MTYLKTIIFSLIPCACTKQTLGLLIVFEKQWLTDRFLFRFDQSFSKTIVLISEKRSFLKMTHSFFNFRIQITIIFEDDRFKNDHF